MTRAVVARTQSLTRAASALQGGAGKGDQGHERPAPGPAGVPVDVQRSASGVTGAVKESHIRHLRQRAVLPGVPHLLRCPLRAATQR